MARTQVEGTTELRLGIGVVARGGECLPGGREPVGFVGQDSPQELSNGTLGLCADELARDLAVAKRDHERDALDGEGLSDGLILVDVDLGQPKRPIRFRRELLEKGPQGPAGSAPGCPEVDHDGELV